MEQSIYIFSDAVDLQHKDKFDTREMYDFVESIAIKEETDGFIEEPYCVQDERDLFYGEDDKYYDMVEEKELIATYNGGIVINSKHPNFEKIIEWAKGLYGTCYDMNQKEMSAEIFFQKVKDNLDKDIKLMVVEVDHDE